MDSHFIMEPCGWVLCVSAATHRMNALSAAAAAAENETHVCELRACVRAMRAWDLEPKGPNRSICASDACVCVCNVVCITRQGKPRHGNAKKRHPLLLLRTFQRTCRCCADLSLKNQYAHFMRHAERNVCWLVVSCVLLSLC